MVLSERAKTAAEFIVMLGVLLLMSWVGPWPEFEAERLSRQAVCLTAGR